MLTDFVNFQNAEPGSVLYECGVVGSPTGKFQYDCLTGAFVGPGYNPFPLVLPDAHGEVQLANDTTTTLPLPSFPGAEQTFPVQPAGYRRHTG